MIVYMEIVGHLAQQSFFSSCIESGKLSHAYIFTGPKSVGKRTVANWLVRELVQESLNEDLVHSDIHIVTQEINEKTGKTKKHIDVDQIRALRSHMTKSSMRGGYRIGIIDDAHKMNVQSANALLKTLEEPGERSLIILITSDEMMLPGTIRSRAHAVAFAPVAMEQIETALVARGASAEHARTLAIQSLGKVGQAISWYTSQGEIFDTTQQALFCGLIGKPLYQKYEAVEKLFGKKIDHIADRAQLTHVLASWQIVLRDSILVSSGHAAYAVHTNIPALPVSAALAAERAIADAITGLSQNIHPRLLLDRILFTLP